MKRFILRQRTLLLLLLSLLTVMACSDQNGAEAQQGNPFLQIDNATVNFEEEGSSATIPIKANMKWECTIPADAGWCTVSQENNALTIKVDNNDQKGIRKTTLQVTAGSITKTIEVAQLGWGKAILLSASSATIGAAGGNVSVEVTTNVDYKPVFSDTWTQEALVTRSAEHPVVTKVLTIHVDPNKGGERSTVVKITDKDNTAGLDSVPFTITQKGLETYEALNIDSIRNDIQVKVTGGKASSFQPGNDIDKSFDGNMSTIYHSNWNNSAANYFPITLEYDFAGGADMDYLVYYPRQEGTNGFFGKVGIEVKTNATRSGNEEWQHVMDYDFQGNSNARKVVFPKPLIGVSAVRLTVKSGYGDGQGFASCAEMQFFRKNPQSFDYSTLFTDPSCSALKAGVTEKQIADCPYSFFQNIAYFMYNHKYDSTFRIHTFKAYPHPDEDAATHKTNPYSLLDNPTGIAVEAGEDLVVLASDLQGQNVSLRVQNLDQPGGDGFGGDSYPLSTGLNKLRILHKGLVYVMYHTPAYQTAPKLTLHFASGKVNGYYDSQDPALSDRAAELLAGATEPYFDVVGKYAHLTFPTARFKENTKDLRALIDAYDKIVYSEMEFMGLVKYNKLFRNRMYLNVMYTSYMYATSYHTAYNDETLTDLCNEAKLMSSACWGPAHEIGHMNQTRPGLRWLGTTEVTNNIMSEYIQTSVFGQPSRLQTEDMKDAVAPNRYSMAWNDMVVKGIAHASEGDVFRKLVPFWQLELYFGKALGRTPLQQADHGGFYPQVYEYIRTHNDLSTPGDQQLEFAYIASVAAGMDLTDFFTKWGFFTPIDITVDDYGKGQMTITQTQADAVKKRIAALGLPKPGVALEYITDNNCAAFRNKAAIVKGTSSRSGDKMTFSGWKNVIVYEVRDGGPSGKLICVSDGQLTPSETASFSVYGGWKNTYKVYAVSYDNKRIEATF